MTIQASGPELDPSQMDTKYHLVDEAAIAASKAVANTNGLLPLTPTVFGINRILVGFLPHLQPSSLRAAARRQEGL